MHVLYFFYLGLGGGYCERENVEYIEREDSEDEIDEVKDHACIIHVDSLRPLVHMPVYVCGAQIMRLLLVFKFSIII